MSFKSQTFKIVLIAFILFLANTSHGQNDSVKKAIPPIISYVLFSAKQDDILTDVTLLFDKFTVLQADSQYENQDALVTRFSDRPRTRHAREDQFQSYDHYVSFYFEFRSSNIEIIDRVAKGGDSIEMNVRTIFPLDEVEAENRWWYFGRTLRHRPLMAMKIEMANEITTKFGLLTILY